jgi:ABC-type nitrate/sulfonate/bicarbonate transport system substrate-binding protein
MIKKALYAAAGFFIAVTGLTILPTPAAAQAPTKLNVAIVSRTVFFLPLWVADARGFLAAENLAIETRIFDSSEKINQALRGGEFQIAITSPETIIAEAYNGGTLRLIAGNAQRLPHFIITKSSIKTLADLKGANIGVLSMNDGTTFLLGDIAKAGGLAMRDFRVEAVGGAPTRWRLLKEGKIDAGLQPFPLSYEAEAAGFNNLGAVAGLIPEYLFTAITVEDGWAKQHRPQVAGFLRALRRGTDDIQAHPDEAAAIGAKELNSSVALTRRALDDTEKLGILSKDLSLPPVSLKRVFVALQDAGVIGRDTAYEPEKFVDESYLKDSRP